MPLATRLRDALLKAGFSQRAFAKAIAAETGGPAEHERRQLLRHLAGENTPDEDRARLYARLLGRPADYFIDEQPTRKVDLLVELHGLVATLTEMIAAAELLSRLEALETQVDAQGEAQTKALKALTAGIRKLERQLAPEAPRAKEETGP